MLGHHEGMGPFARALAYRMHRGGCLVSNGYPESLCATICAEELQFRTKFVTEVRLQRPEGHPAASAAVLGQLQEGGCDIIDEVWNRFAGKVLLGGALTAHSTG